MEETEYKDNEKVLFKTRVTLQGWKSEEADCFITEGHVVIEAKETIKIPVSRIKDCHIPTELETGFYVAEETGTATLTFLDDLNKKRTLRLDTTGRNLLYFKQAIDKQILKQAIDEQIVERLIDNVEERPKNTTLGRFIFKVKERFRDKARDNICAGLRELGINAQMAERGCVEEEVYGRGSLGIIHILEGPIRWVNVLKYSEGGQEQRTRYYNIQYGVPDPRLEPGSPSARIETVRVKSRPLFGKDVDLRWEGGGSYPGIISRLNSDYQLKETIMRSHDVAITPIGVGCWIISTKWHDFPDCPSRKQWSCYQTIATHLLADWSTG